MRFLKIFIGGGTGRTCNNYLEKMLLNISHEKPLCLIEIVSDDKSNAIPNEENSYNKIFRNESDNNFIKKQNIEYLYLNVKQTIKPLGMNGLQNRRKTLHTFIKKRQISYYLNIHTFDFYIAKFCDFLKIRIERLKKDVNYQHLYLVVFYPVYEFYIHIYQKMKKLNHWIYILSFRHAVFLCLF